MFVKWLVYATKAKDCAPKSKTCSHNQAVYYLAFKICCGDAYKFGTRMVTSATGMSRPSSDMYVVSASATGLGLLPAVVALLL